MTTLSHSKRTVRNAFHAGWAAHKRGKLEKDNPHDEFETAAAWCLGWHSASGTVPQWAVIQSQVAGLLEGREASKEAAGASREAK